MKYINQMDIAQQINFMAVNLAELNYQHQITQDIIDIYEKQIQQTLDVYHITNQGEKSC